MAKPYLENLQDLIDRLRPEIDRLNDVECKHFFSGAAAYIDGHIFMSLSPVGLALKLPEDDIELIFSQGAKPLRYFAKSPIKKDYAVLPPQVVNDGKSLCSWVLRSIRFAQN